MVRSQYYGTEPDEVAEQMINQVPIRRFGTRRAVVNQLRVELGGGEEVPIDEDIAFVSESHDRIEDAMLVSEAIDGLSLIEREVVILFYLEDLTVEEVAAIVDVPVGTAKSRLFRARRMLQQALNDKGVEHDG